MKIACNHRQHCYWCGMKKQLLAQQYIYMVVSFSFAYFLANVRVYADERAHARTPNVWFINRRWYMNVKCVHVSTFVVKFVSFYFIAIATRISYKLPLALPSHISRKSSEKYAMPSHSTAAVPSNNRTEFRSIY